MNTEQLISVVEKAFPYVAKPRGKKISFHAEGCFECGALRKDLWIYKNREVPYAAIQTVFNEMSCLSANGWRWVLPSYLRYSLTQEAARTKMETEFLIYNLGPSAKCWDDTRERLSLLNDVQVDCLMEFLLWCKEHEYWSRHHVKDIEVATGFVRSLK